MPTLGAGAAADGVVGGDSAVGFAEPAGSPKEGAAGTVGQGRRPQQRVAAVRGTFVVVAVGSGAVAVAAASIVVVVATAVVVAVVVGAVAALVGAAAVVGAAALAGVVGAADVAVESFPVGLCKI